MRRLGFAVFVFFVATGTVAAGDPAVDRLVRMTKCELLATFEAADSTTAPCGFARGTAIFAAGTPRTVPMSRLTRGLWQGKEFLPDGSLVNRVLGGIRIVPADVYPSTSFRDGRPALVVDYSERSKLLGNVRDEVREVSPGIFLGVTYVRNRAGVWDVAMFFVLEANR